MKEGKSVKVLKKFMAFFLSVCMLLPCTGLTSYAEENTKITEEIIVTTEETLDDVTTEQAEEVTTESEIKEDESESDDADEIKNDSDNEKNAESTVGSEEISEEEQSLQLNYLVIENDYVETPSSQYVVANIGEEGVNISSAVLNYINQTTGVAYTKDADVIQDFLVLFDLDFNDASLAGQYKLRSITYTINEKDFTIDLDEQGLNAVFGVDVEVDANPSAWLVDEEDDTSYSNPDDVAGVIVNDITEGDISAADVEEALLENGFTDVKLEKPAYCYDEDFNETRVSADPASFVVVLDPGHGGHDSGAARSYSGVTVAEREINLKIALACKAELEKSGVTVYLTRYDNNTYYSLTERAQIAENYGADLFISIHNNSSTNTNASGSEVWVPNSSAYNHYAYATGQTLGSDILGMDADLGMLAVDIHAEGRDEAVVDVVEHVQKALVERQSGTEDGCQHDVLLLGQGDVDGTQRCGDGLRLVGQRLGQLVSHQFADTLDVVTEQQAVLLILLVAQFSHIMVHHAVLL